MAVKSIRHSFAGCPKVAQSKQSEIYISICAHSGLDILLHKTTDLHISFSIYLIHIPSVTSSLYPSIPLNRSPLPHNLPSANTVKPNDMRLPFLSPVGHSSPIRVRTGALRRPRGAAATTSVELVPAPGHDRLDSVRGAHHRKVSLPGTKLHCPVSLPAGQHFGVPGAFVNRLRN